jgi:ABC-2 type transport system permease protein
MFERLRAMLRKEFIQVLRDPRMRAVLVVVPLFQVIIFGYAVNTDVRGVHLGLLDLDNTPSSRAFVAAFTGSGYFSATRHLASPAETEDLLDKGTVRAVLRLDSGFQRDLDAGRTAHVQLVLDGTDSNTASIVMGYASRIVASYGRSVMVERAGRSLGAAPPPSLSMVSRAWFNPNLDSRFYFLPAVIALLVMVISIILSSMAIVREREIGTMEQIMVSPIARVEFILGKTLPFAIIGFLDTALISLLATFWFRVPFLGSPLVLFVATGLYLMSTLGVGLFISTISRTQQQAMMTAFFFMQPAILLSGFIYPIANMPLPVQWLTFLNPLRYFLVIIRGVFLKGTGFEVLWPQMLGLLLLGLALLGLATTQFRKTSG